MNSRTKTVGLMLIVLIVAGMLAGGAVIGASSPPESGTGYPDPYPDAYPEPYPVTGYPVFLPHTSAPYPVREPEGPDTIEIQPWLTRTPPPLMGE